MKNLTMKVNEYKVLNTQNGLKLKTIRTNMEFELDIMNYNQSLADFMNKYYDMEDLNVETMYCIAIDPMCMPLGIIQIGQGNETRMTLSDRLSVQFLGCLKADRVVYIHNHPTCVRTTSDQFSEIDKNHLKNLQQMFKTLGCSIYEYLIVYKNGVKALEGEE